jgi:hypothetical protein
MYQTIGHPRFHFYPVRSVDQFFPDIDGLKKWLILKKIENIGIRLISLSNYCLTLPKSFR